VHVELINTGSELMLGRVLNTHQQWLGRRLADAGLPVDRQVAVPDTALGIEQAVAESLTRADLVITTGGLGPTSDDRTRDLIARLLGRRLHEDSRVLENIRNYFTARKRPMPASVGVQAQVPEGTLVLLNENGSAPGLALTVEPGRFRDQPTLLILLPGPPRELRPMFDRQVLPLLRERFPDASAFHCLTLRSCGLGESMVEERLAPSLPPLFARGMEIGYCARTGEVDVRLTGTGPAGAEVVADGERLVREQLGNHVYGTGDDTLESTVIRLATEKSARVAVAESCTGGYLAHRLTNVPGASAAFWGGWLTYDNAAKEVLLGVSSATLRDHGAVSEACAREMAEGALARSGATHALAVTGIAGPGGGSADKPVGTVHLALATAGEPTRLRRQLNPFDRETFKFVTTQQALELLRRRLLGID
jgi:nicotinamide-nucleotide amidase